MRLIRILTWLVTSVALVASACTQDGTTPAKSAKPPTESRNGTIPTFSNPTEITNEYLPFVQGGRWIYEGTKEGKPYLVEVAVTKDTKTVEWNGNTTDALVLRHRGWVEGVLIEEAFDYYAQGDDGGVWYFGEDVDNFENGKLKDHGGSWLAGERGALPALLMPGNPSVGQVFFSEDIPQRDIVERDKVLSLSQAAETPDGSVDNGLLLGATQPDGTTERKIFVPEVGEVLARSEEGEVRLVQRLEDNAESATEQSFSDPTNVDNPYFGVSGVDYHLYFGVDEGEPLRTEVVPTGETKSIGWAGDKTETVVLQFLETSNRDLLEIAVDWFAQDDRGNVWYFGENVWNYEKGRVADMHGTWIAGSDGPPGMIMPAEPTLGRRFNPENIPGLVFETVDVASTNAKYTLPTGKHFPNAIELHETLDDGTEEFKKYVPGYGNVTAKVPGVETVEIVYALPNDAIDARVPNELTDIMVSLGEISVAGSNIATELGRSLDSFVARDDAVPPVLIDLAYKQMDALDKQTARADSVGIRMTALDLEQTVLDIARLYRTERLVDLDAIDMHARRMIAAADSRDKAGAATAAAIANGIADRNPDTVTGPLLDAIRGADAAGDIGDLGSIAEEASIISQELAS